VICRVDFKSATGGNESRAALLPGKVSGRRGAAMLESLAFRLVSVVLSKPKKLHVNAVLLAKEHRGKCWGDLWGK